MADKGEGSYRGPCSPGVGQISKKGSDDGGEGKGWKGPMPPTPDPDPAKNKRGG